MILFIGMGRGKPGKEQEFEKAVQEYYPHLLEEDGTLAMDDYLSRYIPEFANTFVAEVSEAAEVTLAKSQSMICLPTPRACPMDLDLRDRHTKRLAFWAGI